MKKYQVLEDYFDKSYRIENYPTLAQQRKLWSKTRPFEGLNILDATPLCRNSIYKYMNLIYAGANLSIGQNPFASTTNEMLALIKASNIPLVSRNSEPQGFDIVMDCAAQFINFPSRLGRVELTRSGAEIYKSKNEKVFMADAGTIKMIETCIGTGESYFRAMDALGYNDWTDRKLALFGCGKVGQGILKAANERGIKVILISDSSLLKEKHKAMADKVIDFRNRDEVADATLSCYAMVTAVGVKGAIEKTISPDKLITSNLLLANMGAEDEYGESFSAERILAKKDSLNFILEDPTELQYIDATLTLHNLGAEYLLNNKMAQGIIIPPTHMEQELLNQTLEYGNISSKLCELLESNK